MKKAIIPILAIAAGLMFVPQPAHAGVRFGVYVGAPAVVAPPPAYVDPYYDPYYNYAPPPPAYAYPYSYGYGYGYTVPAYRYAPRYYSAPHYRDWDRHDYRGHDSYRGHDNYRGRSRH